MSTAVEALSIGPDSAGIAMTPEEFDAITETDELYRYELIHGVLAVTPIPLESEACPNERLGGLLFLYQRQHAQGTSLDLTLPERYAYLEESRRRLDRLIWAGLGRIPRPKIDVPSIVVEFVSAGKRNRNRDYVLKRDEYRDLGIREYWIVDRSSRTMTVHRNGPDGTLELTIVEGELYQPPLLPGFDLALSELLDAAEDWNDQA